MQLPFSDIVFLNLILMPTILGVFIGYWAGYKNFKKYPWPVLVFIIITMISLLIGLYYHGCKLIISEFQYILI